MGILYDALLSEASDRTDLSRLDELDGILAVGTLLPTTGVLISIDVPALRNREVALPELMDLTLIGVLEWVATLIGFDFETLRTGEDLFFGVTGLPR